jgi:CheY-like chemotaxis protein
MAKIMLVEDDNNLREIYEARLLAEGYEIVSAKDGEEALALAVKEKPELIISDVMMPKISGFDMLDILRSTPETRNTKVIMMTALSQAEDKSRADKLGADKYLVKSQVTLEDVAKVAREVLQGEDAGQLQSESEPTASQAPTLVDTPVAVAPEPQNETANEDSSVPASETEEPLPPPPATEDNGTVKAAEPPTTAYGSSTDNDTPTNLSPFNEPANAGSDTGQTTDPAATNPSPDSPPIVPPTDDNKTIMPTATNEPPDEDDSAGPIFAQGPGAAPLDPTMTQTIQDEENTVDQQIQEFVDNIPAPVPNETAEDPSASPQPTQISPETSELEQSPAVTGFAPQQEVAQIDVAQAPEDKTAAVAENAAVLAGAVNDLMSHETAEPVKLAVNPTNASEPPTETPESDAAPVPPAPSTSEGAMVNGKKIIKPINSTIQKPDLNALLEKEEAFTQTEQPKQTPSSLGVNEKANVVSPIITPTDTPEGGIAPPPPATTINPQKTEDNQSGPDPNSIAL